MGTQQVQLSAGTVEYDDTGGPGRTVVLCHCLLMNGAVWDAVLPHLDDNLRVIRPALPLGSHRVPMRPGADLSLRGQAALLAELLEALDLRDVVLVVSDREVRRDLRAYATAPDFAALGEACEQLGSFDRPAVLLWSRTDTMMPFAHAERLAALLPRGRLVGLDDGGTLLQIDHPARVAEEINCLA